MRHKAVFCSSRGRECRKGSWEEQDEELRRGCQRVGAAGQVDVAAVTPGEDDSHRVTSLSTSLASPGTALL